MTEYISTEYISKVQDEDTGKIAYFKDSKAREDIETLNLQFKDIAKQIENVGNPTQEQINTAINKAIEDGKITGSGININNVKTILSNIMNILYQVNEYKTDMSSLASQTVDLINNLSSGSSTSEEVIVSQDGTTLILTNVSGITNISQDGTTLILK